MKERKELLNQENAQKVKDTAEKLVEAIPDEALEQVTGAGNPFDKLPRVPTPSISTPARRRRGTS